MLFFLCPEEKMNSCPPWRMINAVECVYSAKGTRVFVGCPGCRLPRWQPQNRTPRWVKVGRAFEEPGNVSLRLCCSIVPGEVILSLGVPYVFFICKMRIVRIFLGSWIWVKRDNIATFCCFIIICLDTVKSTFTYTLLKTPLRKGNNSL